MRTPALPAFPPIWRESRIGREAASLLRDPIYRGEGVPDAGGQPVVLIPGFLAGDDSLGLMTRWLRRTGHHTRKAGMRWNVGCAGDSTDRIVERVEALADRKGQRVAIIGQSRGGHFAKVIARRRPDLVSGIVTLGSPMCDPLAIHPIVRAQVFAVGALGTLGAPGLFRRTCLGGDCCESFWADMEGPMPRGVGYLSIYSCSDGIVNWRACLDPHADQVEIDASHIGMALSAAAYRETARALRRFRLAERRRVPATPIARAA